MGDAKRRAKEIAKLKEQERQWRISLTAEEQMILELSERLDQRLVRGRKFSGGCYHLAFFMTRYLALRGIDVTPAIGWVNDGTWEGVMSHGWIEYQEKITDVSLTYTAVQPAQPIGALIVLDHILSTGEASYTYYKNDDPEALKKNEWLRKNAPELRAVMEHKEKEHLFMLDIASSNNIEKYLASAPPGGRFEDIARLVE